MIEAKFESELRICLHAIAEVEAGLGAKPTIKRALLIVGEAKVGKTAFMHHLLGKKLNHQKNEMGVYVMHAGDPQDPAQIGSDYSSTTLTPNFELPSSSEVDAAPGACCVDMPGYGDDRPLYKLLKLLVFYRTLEHIEEVHICQLFSEQEFDAYHLLREIEKTCNFLRSEVLLADKCLSFVLTKVEDEGSVETFEQLIRYIKEQNETGHLTSELECFEKKNKYLFRNTQLEPAEGVQLKNTIEGQNNFFRIQQHPYSLLSESFFQAVVGENQLEEFYSYLRLLIEELSSSARKLIRLSFLSILYEYVEVISRLTGQGEEALRLRLVDEIQQLKATTGQEDYSVVFRQSEELALRSQNYLKLDSIFTRIDQKGSSSFLRHLRQVFNPRVERWAKLSAGWVCCLYQKLGQQLSLLFTIDLVKDEHVIQLKDQFERSSEVNDEIEKLYSIWEDNQQQLSTIEGYVQALHSQASGSINRIIKKPCFKQIKNRVILQAVNKAKEQTTQQPSPPLEFVKDVPLEPQSIARLDNTSSTFALLIAQLEVNTQANSQTTKAIIRKIATIFSRFSLFEEAIVTMMSLQDQEAVERLVQEGSLYKELSYQFVRDILSKYYWLCGWAAGSSRFQFCSNYVSSIVENPEQWISFEKVLRQRHLLKQNIGSSFKQHEQYESVDYYYIHPLVELQHHYAQLLRQKEALFERSTCHLLLNGQLLHSLLP